MYCGPCGPQSRIECIHLFRITARKMPARARFESLYTICTQGTMGPAVKSRDQDYPSSAMARPRDGATSTHHLPIDTCERLLTSATTVHSSTATLASRRASPSCLERSMPGQPICCCAQAHPALGEEQRQFARHTLHRIAEPRHVPSRTPAAAARSVQIAKRNSIRCHLIAQHGPLERPPSASAACGSPPTAPPLDQREQRNLQDIASWPRQRAALETRRAQVVVSF